MRGGVSTNASALVPSTCGNVSHIHPKVMKNAMAVTQKEAGANKGASMSANHTKNRGTTWENLGV